MTDRRSIAVFVAAVLVLSIGCGDDSDRRRAAITPTPVIVRSATPAPTEPGPSVSPTREPTPAGTPQSSPTPTATSCECNTPTATSAAPTPTATPAVPEITYFGIARADDAVLTPAQYDAGRPVFVPLHGQGITIVLEARHGVRPLVRTAYDPSGGLRGIDLLVSRPLGDGSPAVCDIVPPAIGGVPGTDPPIFSEDAGVVDAINDLCCRVNDGTGAPFGRDAQDACTRLPPGDDYAFIEGRSELQYCLPIAKAWSFGVGDTIVAARVRDVAGTVSATRELVVHVAPETPFTCDTGLGERQFTVRRPPSRLLTSASGGNDASADPWAADGLRICAGADLGDGVHALAIREDAILALPLVDGGTLCARISARGSSGSIDCDGGTPADVRAAQEAGGLTRVAVDTGLGVDAGTGAATISAPIAVLQLPPGSAADACQTADYPTTFTGALTTARGTAEVLARDGTVVAEVSGIGAAFDCATWRAGGGGTLVLPFPLVQPSGAGDLAAVVELSD